MPDLAPQPNDAVPVVVANVEPLKVEISGPDRAESALITAADKVSLEKVNADKVIALEKIAADERREKREFNKMLILAIPTIIGALAAAYAAVRIDNVGHSVNSMKDELVESVRKESHAEGLIEGKSNRNGNP